MLVDCDFTCRAQRRSQHTMPKSPHRRSGYLPSALLVSLETVLFLGAPLLAAALHFKILHIESGEMSRAVILPAAAVYAAASLVSMFALGLYTSRRSSFPGLLLRIGLALAIATFASMQLLEHIPALAVGGALLAATTAIAFLVSVAIRITFDCIQDHEASPRVVLVLGAGTRAAAIARLRRRADQRSFTVSGFVVMPGDQPDGIAAEMRLDVRDDLLAYCEQQGVEEIVIAMDDHRHVFPLARVNECRDAGIAITSLGAFLERETGGIRLDALESSDPTRSERSRQDAQSGGYTLPITQPMSRAE